jgi:hypothetical protein
LVQLQQLHLSKTFFLLFVGGGVALEALGTADGAVEELLFLNGCSQGVCVRDQGSFLD